MTGRKGPGRDSTSAKAIATAERHAQWLEDRKAGMAYRAIAARDGVRPSTVQEAVARALAEIRSEPAEDVRKLEIDRLDEQLERLRKRAVSEAEPDASEALILKLAERRAKLLGLDAPSQSKVTVDTPREEMWSVIREWLKRPTPELEAIMSECGWIRAGTSLT